MLHAFSQQASKNASKLTRGTDLSHYTIMLHYRVYRVTQALLALLVVLGTVWHVTYEPDHLIRLARVSKA